MKRLNRRQIRKLVSNIINEQRYAPSPSSRTLDDFRIIEEPAKKVEQALSNLDSFSGPGLVAMHALMHRSGITEGHKVAYQTEGRSSVIIMPSQSGNGFDLKTAQGIADGAKGSLAGFFDNAECVPQEIQDSRDPQNPMGGYIVICSNYG